MQRTIKSEEMERKEIEHRNITIEFMDLIGSGRFKEGLRFCAPDCRTHNPYTTGGMGDLTDAMDAAKKEMSSRYPNAEFAIKHVLADGDMVAVHTQILSYRDKPGEGGLRQVHLFRFEGDKIDRVLGYHSTSASEYA